MQMLNQCFDDNKCDTSIKTGILNLIPKKGKDSRYLKNLRPITLLNVDYKIIEKMIGTRLDIAIKELVHGDQTGFMAGKTIFTNIRRVFDLQQYCEKEEIEGVLINLDFIKCFDRISHNCIQKTMDFFQIPEYIKKWINILYDGFCIKIQNNGKFTEVVNVQRSVHQGGCASVQIFLLCAEVIALELRQCEAIKGIPVEEIIHLLNQYADDMNVASLYNQESLNAIFSKLELFRQNSGFSINYDKTAIYRMGPVVHASAEAVLYTASQVAWTSKPINVLGITVSHQQHEILNNYKVLAPKIRSVLNTWKGRNLSLMGKVFNYKYPDWITLRLSYVRTANYA